MPLDDGLVGTSFRISNLQRARIAPSESHARPTSPFTCRLYVPGRSTLFLRRPRWRVVWPFLLGSLPFAFIGGAVQLPGEYYRAIVGIVLILSGLRMFWAAHIYAAREVHDPPIWLSILLGIGIGFLSGLTGTGGGIFLSPVIIFLAWSDLRTTSGIAAVFILGNSIAGLLGNLAMVRSLPSELPMYIVAVMLGALIGTAFGTKFSIIYIRRALGVVLIIAGLKLIGVY